MPRKPRCSQPGRVYHLISRLVDREWFIKDESDREQYIRLLARAFRMSDWRSLGYAVMSNHFHHAVVAGHTGLDALIRPVHGPFADALNKKYGRIGAVFVRGPKQLPVREDGVAPLLAYIHNNPVRAMVVADAASSDWTSHRAYAGLERAPAWLHVEQGLKLAGFGDANAFDAYVRMRAIDSRHDAAGDRHFVRDPEAYLEFHDVPETPVLTAQDIVEATAQVLDVPPDFLRSRRRSRLHVFARHVACVTADRLGLTGSSIAAASGLSPQGVSFILGRPSTDEVVQVVETVVSRLASGER